MSGTAKERWDARYQANDIPWNLGTASKPLMELVMRHTQPPARIMVPGCGLAWEVEALAREGFRTEGMDLSPMACKLARQRINNALGVEIHEGDFLNLHQQHRECFDVIVEHTCFCAIGPEQRDAYVQSCVQGLKTGGLLMGLFLHFEGGGPPHGTNPNALRSQFGGHFEVESLSQIDTPFGPKGCPQIALVLRKRS